MARYSDEYWDHRRDELKHERRPADDQRCAVASLIGHCEAIAESGLLSEPAELSLRVLIAQTLAAFNMPSKMERQRERV